jgi:hypothetical protein
MKLITFAGKILLLAVAFIGLAIFGLLSPIFPIRK